MCLRRKEIGFSSENHAHISKKVTTFENFTHPMCSCQTFRYQGSGSLQFQDTNHQLQVVVVSSPAMNRLCEGMLLPGQLCQFTLATKNRGWLTQVIWDTGSKSMLNKNWTCSLLRWTINKCFNVSSSLGCRRFQEQFGAIKPGSEVKPLFSMACHWYQVAPMKTHSQLWGLFGWVSTVYKIC